MQLILILFDIITSKQPRKWCCVGEENRFGMFHAKRKNWIKKQQLFSFACKLHKNKLIVLVSCRYYYFHFICNFFRSLSLSLSLASSISHTTCIGSRIRVKSIASSTDEWHFTSARHEHVLCCAMQYWMSEMW